MSKDWFASKFDVSRETLNALDLYVAALLKWTKTVNLISKSSAGNVWSRHVADSAQLYQHVEPKTKKLTDLGSGGGFPGIVLAILSKPDIADRQLVLIESDQRKAAFLAQISTSLNLNVKVLAERAESATPQNSDVLTCRGYAPLNASLYDVARHLTGSGYAILPKGAQAMTEVDAALIDWNFTLETIQSITHPEAKILKISDLSAKKSLK